MSLLYLASQSPIRQQLLREAQIPFELIAQDINEALFGGELSFKDRILEIAQAKMQHARVPAGVLEGECCWVLTADSMVQNSGGEIIGKPHSYEHAVAILKGIRGKNCSVATAFCCERRVWKESSWHTNYSECLVVDAQVLVEISDIWIYKYLEQHPYALQTAGVLVVEGYGAQFIKKIEGSYTTVLGLPMFEVREALERSGFFKH